MEAKKKRFIAQENLPADARAAFDEKYPRGLADYLQDAEEVRKPSGETIYAVRLEMEDTVYLVKVDIKVDSIDVNEWLEGDSEEGDQEGDYSGGDGEGTLPDENISQYSGGEDEAAED